MSELDLCEDLEGSDEWDGYESGPFCRHWGDPSDCDEVCKCGHKCRQHDTYDDYCECGECNCEGYEDAEEEVQP